MSKHVHFDLAEVDTATTKLQEQSRANMEEPGSRGAQARFNVAVIKHFAMQLAEEANRGSEDLHVLDGVAAVLTNICWTYVSSITIESTPPEIRARVINSLMERFGEFLSHALENDDPEHQAVVRAMEGGTA